MDTQKRSIDKAAQEMIDQMAQAGQQNAWDRLEAQSPQCGFGKQGVCCRICTMGPCRISKKAPLGVCGADADTIVARNFLRAVASGTSAHSDHGRGVAEVFIAAAKGEAPKLPFRQMLERHLNHGMIVRLDKRESRRVVEPSQVDRGDV